MPKVKKKITRRDAVYRIALAGVAAGVALLCVWLGVVVRYCTIAFFVAASLAVMVPMTRKYYLSSVFAYAVAAGLGFVIAGDIAVVAGFVVYFGPMALITGLFLNLKVKWFFALPAKIAYINGALALMYFVCHNIMIELPSGKVHYAIIAVVGTVAGIGIDFVLQFLYLRISPILGKVLKGGKSEDSVESVEEGSPFEEFQPQDDAFALDIKRENSTSEDESENALQDESAIENDDMSGDL